MQYEITRLSPDNLHLMDATLDCFSDVFDEPETYSLKRPSREYLAQLLSESSFICLAAVSGTDVLGALAAYELRKFEQ